MARIRPCSAYTLHHLGAPQQFPEEARSVLCPGGVLLIVDWIKGARTGVPERYLALQTVAGWVRKAGFQLLFRDVRGQSMVVVGKLPTAGPEPKAPKSEQYTSMKARSKGTQNANRCQKRYLEN